MTSPRPRIAALATGLTVAALALAGCSATNPIQSEKVYSASDGVRAQIGDVRATNLLVIAAAKGAPGLLIGGLVNDGDQDQQVTITIGSADPVTLPLAAHQTLLLQDTKGENRTRVDVPVVDTRPGGTTDTILGTGTGGSTQLHVPVLDGTLPEYATLVPTPTPKSTPKATPSPTATATAAATPTPTPSPST